METMKGRNGHFHLRRIAGDQNLVAARRDGNAKPLLDRARLTPCGPKSARAKSLSLKTTLPPSAVPGRDDAPAVSARGEFAFPFTREVFPRRRDPRSRTSYSDGRRRRSRGRRFRATPGRRDMHRLHVRASPHQLAGTAPRPVERNIESPADTGFVERRPLVVQQCLQASQSPGFHGRIHPHVHHGRGVPGRGL